MPLLRVIRLLGLVLMVFAPGLLFPTAVSLLLDDGVHTVYEETLLAALATGALLYLAGRRERGELQVRDGFLLVVLVWTLLPVYGALPLLRAVPGLSFTDAYFEAVSGLTASGATVLSGLDRLPPSLNLWRGFMVWLGGMGVIVLAVAILPLLGAGGAQLFRAETPGPMKDTKLTPRIAETAKGLWLVYVGLTLLCALAYRGAGMDTVDALMHAFTTMGLGGFSTHDASFAHWNSPRIEAVAIVFMLVAGVNFATHFLAFHRRSLGAYARDPEFRPYAAVLALSVLGVAAYLWLYGEYADAASALRYAAFNVVSIATTTGYANTDFDRWPLFAPLWMLLLSCFASCSGSTGSGIKMIRARILFAQTRREFLRIVHPRVFQPVKLGAQLAENRVVFAVLAYLFLYSVSVIAGTLLLVATGLDLLSAFSAAVASVNNLGPGLGAVGPARTYADLGDFQTWVCTFLMLAGRLELYTLFVVMTPAFWRK